MRLIDLSHRLDEATPVYPGDRIVSLRQERNLEADSYNAYALHTGLHAGTHIDVPLHLTACDKTAADYSIDRFAGEGLLLDLREDGNALKMHEAFRSLSLKNKAVLLYTGWDAQFRSGHYFTSHPAVSEALGAFLLSQDIKMLGLDFPSPDHPPFSFHRAALAQGIMILENLTGLGRLKGLPEFEVYALPLFIPAEASPVRAVCRIP